jgi:autotransporter-associated beta strand protein
VNKSLVLALRLGAGLPLALSSAPAQPGVYSGVYANGEGGLTSTSDWKAVTNFVTEAQKDLSLIHNFDSWTDTPSSTNGTEVFPTAEMSNIRSHGSIPLFTWQPQNGTLGTTQSFTLANIIAGDYDAYITTWASSAKAWGYPFFLRLAHEMNGNWYPWCAGVNGNTAAQYVQMWQHVHSLFTSVGATNVTWVWCVNMIYSGSTPINTLYPGDNYVDWIALDGYNRLANPWQDFSAIAAATVAQLTNVAPGKPIMVAETGCNQTNYPPETKAQWFLNALTDYLPAMPRLKAWVYFNSTNATDGNDWRITSPSNAVTGYQQGMGGPYYDTNRYGAMSNSPIPPLLYDETTNDTMPPFVSIVSPATDLVTNGSVVQVLALASDKSGISNVVFALNGAPQQTNTAPPYQFLWTVPGYGAVSYFFTATAFDNAGNSAVSTVQLTPQGTSLNVLQTVSEGTGTNWNAASWGGPPAAPPVNGNNYETPNAFFARTPNSTTPAAFAGASLQLDSGGTLYLKNGGETGGNAANVNLLLNGGDVRFHGGFGVNGAAVSGTVQVLANSLMDTDQTPPNNGDIWLQSALSGSGNLTVNLSSYTNALILSGNNSAYTGNWTNASAYGSIKILSGTPNALGMGNVILLNPNASLVINITNPLALNNQISGPGAVYKTGSGTLTLNNSNTYSGLTIVSNGVLQLGAGASLVGTPAIQLSSGAVLNVSALPGGLALDISQTLSGVGSVLGNVTVQGTISPGPLGTLSFSNALVLAGDTVMELNRTNAPSADLISAATMVLGGTLTVTNLGGALQAGDSFQLLSGNLSGSFAATNLPALSRSNLFWDTSRLGSQGILAVDLETALPPMLMAPRWNGTEFTLQVSSQEGFNYVLEGATQLAPANWVSLQTNTGGGTLTFAVPLSPATPQQFFRISVH